MMSEPAQSTTPKSRHLGRMLPAAVLVTGLVLFFVLDLDRYFDLEMLREHRNGLQERGVEILDIDLDVFVAGIERVIREFHD